jgi:hypothetical protein
MLFETLLMLYLCFTHALPAWCTRSSQCCDFSFQFPCIRLALVGMSHVCVMCLRRTDHISTPLAGYTHTRTHTHTHTHIHKHTRNIYIYIYITCQPAADQVARGSAILQTTSCPPPQQSAPLPYPCGTLHAASTLVPQVSVFVLLH